MDKDLITVVIPTYNRADTIIKCLESVFNQTYRNIEIIVVDDCSSDNTNEVLKSISDSRLKYYRLEKNSGACFARNYGIKHALGEYIAFQDSDDTWHPDKLKKELNCLKEKRVDMVFCGMNRSCGNSSFYFPKQKVNCSNNFFEQELIWNAVSTQTILMKREVALIVAFDTSFKKYQDWDFAIRVSENYKIAYLNEALVDSIVQDNSVSLVESHFDALKCIYEKYKDIIAGIPKVEAKYNEHFGDCFRKNDSKLASEYYRKSLKNRFDFKVCVKFTIALLRIKI